MQHYRFADSHELCGSYGNNNNDDAMTLLLYLLLAMLFFFIIYKLFMSRRSRRAQRMQRIRNMRNMNARNKNNIEGMESVSNLAEDHEEYDIDSIYFPTEIPVDDLQIEDVATEQQVQQTEPKTTGPQLEKTGDTAVPVDDGYEYDQVYAYNNIVSYNIENPLYDSVFISNDSPAQFNNYTDINEIPEIKSQYSCAADLVNLSEGQYFNGKK